MNLLHHQVLRPPIESRPAAFVVGVVYFPYDQFHVLGNVVWAVVFALFEPFRCDHQPYRFVRCFAFFRPGRRNRWLRLSGLVRSVLPDGPSSPCSTVPYHTPLRSTNKWGRHASSRESQEAEPKHDVIVVRFRVGVVSTRRNRAVVAVVGAVQRRRSPGDGYHRPSVDGYRVMAHGVVMARGTAAVRLWAQPGRDRGVRRSPVQRRLLRCADNEHQMARS